MDYYLLLIPTVPLASALVLALAGRMLSARTIALAGAGAVGASALLSLAAAIAFIGQPVAGHRVVRELWTWMSIDGNALSVSFSLDALSLVMVLVITVVGFLIHLYATEYMAGDEGYCRFFSAMNLFVGFMLVLVLADSFPLLYLGWEGVGLCSYLLIGFWYREPANGAAARKAFIVTRVGDTAMALGIFLLFTELGTLNIQASMAKAAASWTVGSPTAMLAAGLLLGGAVGKSAQLPLQVWLPDAMAGPTPVSALIHAATMVTAGVYLVARTHALFELAPVVQQAVAVIGSVTLLVAGCSALVQRDIKRVLAYSTISQLGYMFVALGIGAWSAAIFHLVTHAFFKALLFLGAGAVILAQHHEQDMFRMGGLRKELPVTFWTFLLASASLSAIPLVTAGFYSKDLILWDAWASPRGGIALWSAGLLGAFITTLYSFRMVFVTFFGPMRTPVSRRPGVRMHLPLVVLAILSVVGGLVELPHLFGDVRLFSRFLATVLPPVHLAETSATTEWLILAVTEVVQVVGIGAAILLFLRHAPRGERMLSGALARSAGTFLSEGWRFDALYVRILVRPLEAAITRFRKDPVDSGYSGLAALGSAASARLSMVQNGRLRWYAAGMALGAALFLGIILFL